ncbi:MAG TPA: hypothetical protein VKE40_27925 [Gemmataceae bacterium]|nr:hypothetical protein [Gemmataceae bacterium]
MFATNPVTVRTLLGQKTLEVSLTCLPTLARYSADPVRLIVHEDGTLGDAGRNALRQALPGAEFVGRAESDAAVVPRLAKYPRCLAARSSSPLFLKVFDIALLETGELRYADSDVLFLRRYAGLFGGASLAFPAVFMADVKEAYAVRPWHLWPVGPVRLGSRVNTGVVRARPAFLDLDFLEWLLGRLGNHPVWGRRWYWAEQTCWAALAGRARCGLWDPRQLVVATADMAGYGNESVAVHFVSTFRHHLFAYAGRNVSPGGPPASIRVRAAARVGPVGQLASDLRARVRGVPAAKVA